MEVRLATVSDADIISSLNFDVQRLHYNAHPHLFKPPSPEVFPAGLISELICKPDNYFYVAVEDDKPVGYIYITIRRQPENSFRYAFDMVYIDQISMRPEHRHKGGGRLLLQEAVKLAHSLDIKLVALDTWAFNSTAHAFFEEFGFSDFNRRMWMNA